MRYTYHCALRWSDLDAYGHVNNARFLTLYEEARVAMMFVGARDAGVVSFEEGIVVSRHEVDYLRPVDYGDPVRIELWIDDLKPSRFTVAYELYDGELLASRARSVLVPYDLVKQRPRRLSQAEHDFLAPWLPPGSRSGPDDPAPRHGGPGSGTEGGGRPRHGDSGSGTESGGRPRHGDSGSGPEGGGKPRHGGSGTWPSN